MQAAYTELLGKMNGIVAYSPFVGNDSETNEIKAIARQQLHKYATVSEPLLGSDLRTTMEALLKTVFFMCPLQGYITQPTELR
jgi:hypothetical protein